MKRSKGDELDLGADVVQRLLPHRQPLLMVDRITHYGRDRKPQLQAQRFVSANEPVFAGHFPGLQIWPGVYTQEGLGQSCLLYVTLRGLQDHWEAQGGDPAEVLAALRNLELGYRMHPGFSQEQADALLQRLPRGGVMGFSAAVELKFLAPVFAGQRIDYAVSQTHDLGEMRRFEVQASVDGKPVVRGFMTGRVGGVALPRLGGAE